MGPFNQEFRSKMLNSWFKLISAHHIPHSPNLIITSSLVDSTTVVEWNLQGLPSDELSTQNGIIVTQGTRYPLLIDPQGQGRGWIKAKEKQRDLIVGSLSQCYYITIKFNACANEYCGEFWLSVVPMFPSSCMCYKIMPCCCLIQFKCRKN